VRQLSATIHAIKRKRHDHILVGEGASAANGAVLREVLAVELTVEGHVTYVGEGEASLLVVDNVRLAVTATLPVVLVLLEELVLVPQQTLVLD
jgi:hypothetical protein